MDKNGLLWEIHSLYEECPGNVVSETQALCPEVIRERLFETPLHYSRNIKSRKW